MSSELGRLESQRVPSEGGIHEVSTKSRSCVRRQGLLTNLKQAFSYWEREVRKLRAERACAGEFAQQRVRESTPEVSTPHTPAIASPPPQQWRAPEADMYGHDNVKRRHITASREERFAEDVRSR